MTFISMCIRYCAFTTVRSSCITVQKIRNPILIYSCIRNIMFQVCEKKDSLIEQRIKLNNNESLPIVSFGTFRIGGSVTELLLDSAFSAGYRGVDTAAVYNNEEDIGKALKKLLPKHNLTRGDIFITTKLAPGIGGNEQSITDAIRKSLKKLNTPYIDLLLVHWPGGNSFSNPYMNALLRKDTWNTLIRLYDNGRGTIKAIGVSNYTEKHLQQLIDATSFPPAVNQIEFHPYWKTYDALEELCKKSGIVLQAYSPLGGDGTKEVLSNSVITSIASKYNYTPAQVVLRWAVQRDYAIVSKSRTENRIIENSKINVELAPEDVDAINKISTHKKFAWNPDHVN